MREYPVFIPFSGDYLSAVVTLPDGDPRGLVILTTGVGATRTHRYSLWTRTARRMASHGLGSLRLDYKGVGDSSGMVWEQPMNPPPADEAEAAVRFGMGALGLDRFAVVGNCMGANVALDMAASMPECLGAVCILGRVRATSGTRKLLFRARRWRVVNPFRRNRMIRRLDRRLLRRSGKARQGVADKVRAALAHGGLRFLYSEEDKSYGPRVRKLLEGIVAPLPPGQRERFELRVVSGGPLQGFDSLEIQDLVSDTVMEWVLDAFSAVPRSREPIEAQA
jgi:pimeloyl-ACP methyl ester carboxylesterase